MATRTITGLIHHASGAVWVGATVTFEMEAGAFTISPDVTFLRDGVTAVTDTAGAFSVTLTSGLSVYWRVSLPDGDGFRFALADGSTTTLEALRSASEGLPTPLYSGVEILITGAEEGDVLVHDGTQFVNASQEDLNLLATEDYVNAIGETYVWREDFETKGDILAAISAGEYSIVSASEGGDGRILTADSTASTGLGWRDPPSLVGWTWTPLDTTVTIKAWYDASAITAQADGTALVQWDDLSGNAHHATQGTAGDRPLYQTNELNSLPGVEWVSADYYNTTLLADSLAETIIAVVDVDSLAAQNTLLGGEVGGRTLRLTTSGELQYGKCGVSTLATGGPTIAINTPSIIGGTLGATTGEFHTNGVVSAFSHAETFTASTTTQLGAETNDRPWDGVIYEVIVTSTMTDAERERYEGYLAHKWGITARLSSDHPYKSAAPKSFTNAVATPTFTVGPFHRPDPTGSTADQEALIAYLNTATTITSGLESASATTENQWRMPTAGAIIGAFLMSDDARTAGTATLTVRVNDTFTAFAAGACVLDATNTLRASAYDNTGVAFAAGDRIGVGITTASWTPTTANLTAYLIARLS